MDPSGWVVAYPQSIDPQPRIVADVQFRRALMYATDRQQMVDTLIPGLPVADSVFTPGTPEFEATKDSIVRYEYDPRRAVRMLEELFHFYVEHPRELGAHSQKRVRQAGLHRVECDYLAGMTDRYVIQAHQRFFGVKTVLKGLAEPG